jgi:transposase
MNRKPKAGSEYREQVVQAAVSRREDETLEDVARQHGVKLGTLKGWLKASKKASRAVDPMAQKSAASYAPAEQLEALLEVAKLGELERSAWCRARGLFPHHLQQFRQQLSAPLVVQSEALRESKRREEQLARELKRKDKALAEAAALLVLQKKFQSLFAGEAE